jgi:hypothetical protein
MLSRKHRRIVLALLAASAATLAPARATSGPHRAAPGHEEKPVSQSLLAVVKSLWGLFDFAHPWPPSPPPGDGNGHSTGEGTGICPHGHM